MIRKKNPFLKYVDDFEKEAELFLVHYGYQDLVTNPSPIPIREIIEKKMSLEIIDTEFLSPDASIQGITAFFPGTVEVFDWYEKDYVGYVLKEPSILIDSIYTNEGYINRILAHEAYHWYKHRAYFNYELHQSSSDEFAIRCISKSNYDARDNSWTDQQRMEYQARKIAPLLLLPKQSIINKVFELTGKGVSDFSKDEVDIRQLVDELSDFYKVTSYTMKSRLMQLGYDVDVNTYENNSSMLYVKDSCQKYYEQNKCIDLVEAFEIYQTNEQFRQYIDTGAFAYKNDGICSKYGDVKDSYNLVFQTKLIPDFKLNSSDLMFRQNQTYTNKKVFSNQPQNVEAYDKAKQLQDKFLKEHTRKVKNMKTANQTIYEYMREAKWNVSIFQDKTLLNPMDFTRIKREHNFGLKAYAAMAVGLGLSLEEFIEIINLAGFTLIKGNKEHDAYSFIMSSMNGENIDSCNDFLESIGVDKLGAKTRMEWNDNQFK